MRSAFDVHGLGLNGSKTASAKGIEEFKNFAMKLKFDAMDATLFCCLTLFCCIPLCSASDEASLFESVPDLVKSMYVVVDGYPCVRLLNLSGEIGCSNPGHEKVVAPVVRFKNMNELVEPSAILVSVDEMESLLIRVSRDPNLATRVAGVLVESGTLVQNKLKGFSPDRKFPEAEFSPYQSKNFEWNPIGSGIMWNAYNFPVFLLSEGSTPTLQEIATKNEKSKKSYKSIVAEFDLVMQTTKSRTHDSESCLREGACLPLGGYSVWSALPPIDVSSSKKSKPIILVVASMDTSSFFRDKSLGADSPISGLITLLAAVDALSHMDNLDGLSKQLVFAVFTGEAWGFLGSRRFLFELDQHSDAIAGLNFSQIEQVIEIGSVGKTFNQEFKRIFAHTTGVTSVTNETMKALQTAQDSLEGESIKVSMARNSNPGIPPSSLMTFLRKNAQISGVVLEDFDSAFTNKFYHSHLDGLSNINATAVVAASSLVARTLYILANIMNTKAPSLTSIHANASLVEDLLGCLLNCVPGLSCDLLKQYISPSSTCPSNYVGVILGEPSSSLYPDYVGDVSRFVWNYLADKTSIPSRNKSSSCPKDCKAAGEVCIRGETDGKGICVVSSTRYVPAYSTRLKFEADSWSVLPYNASDVLGEADPVWTESNWDVIQLRVYTVQDSSFDYLVLFLGISVTVLAYLTILIIKTFIRKALKRD